MKIGFTTYPSAFQSKGGLEVHIKQTLAALRELGCEVDIVDPYHEHLADYDLIHHFSLNHASFRILQEAKLHGVPCVLTPMVEPIQSAWRLRKIGAVRYLMHRIFGNEFRSRWDDTVDGLCLADAITPITEVEGAAIARLVPGLAGRIQVIPNGVTEAFFQADVKKLLPEHRELGRFVLMASNITSYKNQLPVIRAARRAGFNTVLVGAITDRQYFDACMAAGGEAVSYLGEFEYPSPELTALFAAAGLVVLASHVEPFGLVPFEALAAGTPAVLTRVSGFNKPASPPYYQRVNPRDDAEIESVIRAGMEAPERPDLCRELVEDMRWSNVARQLLEIYRGLLKT